MTGASAYDRLIDALAYAQAGWPVLPVALEVKAPLTRHGFYDASTDPEIVARWWNEWPRARIGLWIPERVAIADVESTAGHGVDGMGKLDQLQAELCPLPDTGPLARTATDGRHWFLALPDDVDYDDLDPHPWGPKAGIDLKTHNGYVVLPPEPGREWIRDLTAPLPVWPAEWVAQIKAKPAPKPAPKPRRERRYDGTSVADGYSEKNSWADVLEPKSWTCVHGDGEADGSRWRHPDASQPDSAVIKYGKLFVHSTRTDFDVSSGKSKPNGYTKFRAYAVLDHKGDLSAAARSLRRNGEVAPSYGFAIPAEAPRRKGNDDNMFQETDTTPSNSDVARPGEGTYTDSGMAAHLIDQRRDVYRYVPEVGMFVGWDEMRWKRLPDAGKIEHAARDLASKISVPTPITITKDSTDAEKAEDRAIRALAAFKLRCLSKNGILAAVRIAQADPDFQVTADLLDTNAYELNTLSGIVDLRTGKLLPHNKESWHTKITGVGYDDAGTKSPEWDAFLHTTFEGNQKLIRYMQQLAGYACIGEVTHHVLPFLHGDKGNNGKSVLLNVFQTCLGDYSVVLPISALVVGRNGHTEDTADLPGARLAVCVEVGHSTKWDEEKIKGHTGGDRLYARANYGHKYPYKPSHTIMIAANDKPHVETGGKSFFRRFKVIPFNHSIPEDEINENLTTELIEREGPAILAWMVRGAIDVLANGLQPPAEVTDATTEYAESEDDVGQWISDCCIEVDKEMFGTPGSDLYRSYQSWCERSGIEPKSLTGFGIALGKHGFPLKRSKSTRQRMGIKLIDDPKANRAWEDRD